jgi:hypothetical protein
MPVHRPTLLALLLAIALYAAPLFALAADAKAAPPSVDVDKIRRIMDALSGIERPGDADFASYCRYVATSGPNALGDYKETRDSHYSLNANHGFSSDCAALRKAVKADCGGGGVGRAVDCRVHKNFVWLDVPLAAAEKDKGGDANCAAKAIAAASPGAKAKGKEVPACKDV